MNRRELFRGLAGVAGALILPPSVADAAEEVGRRWWALGAIPERTIETRRPAYMGGVPFPYVADLTRHMSEQEAIIYYAIAQVTGTKTIEPIPGRYVIPNSLKVKYGL